MHCHAEAISGDLREFLKSVFAAAAAESEERCVRGS